MVNKIQAQNLLWVDIKRPKKADIEFLEKKYRFHPVDLADSLSKIQLPKLSFSEDYLFIILQIPIFNKRTKTILSAKIDIFVNDDFLVTIHREKIAGLEEIFQKCVSSKKARENHMESASGLLYDILLKILNYYRMLNHTRKKIDKIEKKIFKSQDPKIVEDISLVRREVTDLVKIIIPQKTVLRKLVSKNNGYIAPQFRKHFQDLLDNSQKISETLENQKDIIESLQDTSESLASYRLNHIIKILTIFSIILGSLNFILQLYFISPGARKPENIFGLSIIMISAACLGIAMFLKKKWL
ncbi:hypothetical protein COY23_00095 [bacterium (Candidatus Torokbacteria) CG_4_10_14_0_2_um_filter_35_8]|nr:MAG: hypothetical protein COY23_00095 [bacterium (Candidatus Torokbacteria) CG_4_10_14_0_2_um_filter_35_8]